EPQEHAGQSLTRHDMPMAQRWDPGRPLLDMSPGRWLQERLWIWGAGSNRQGVAVGSLVPEGFEAYARVLHPATSETERGFESVRWSVMASWTRRTVHPLAVSSHRRSPELVLSAAPPSGDRPLPIAPSSTSATIENLLSEEVIRCSSAAESGFDRPGPWRLTGRS